MIRTLLGPFALAFVLAALAGCMSLPAEVEAEFQPVSDPTSNHYLPAEPAATHATSTTTPKP